MTVEECCSNNTDGSAYINSTSGICTSCTGTCIIMKNIGLFYIITMFTELVAQVTVRCFDSNSCGLAGELATMTIIEDCCLNNQSGFTFQRLSSEICEYCTGMYIQIQYLQQLLLLKQGRRHEIESGELECCTSLCALCAHKKLHYTISCFNSKLNNFHTT